MEDFYDTLLNKIKEDDFYALLGCDELSTTEQINAEFRQKAKLHHPDKNPGDKAAENLFERIKHARNILCDEESRRKYDHWRRSGIAVPYEQWIELSGAVHTSLHWAAKPKKELMIEFKNGDDDPVNKFLGEDVKTKRHLQSGSENAFCMTRTPIRRCGWSSKRGVRLSKFRRYEI